MKSGIRAIIRAGIWSYEKSHDLPIHVRKAARRIFRCKTSALGRHVHICRNGHSHPRWNSCHHRSCPECAWPAKKRWLNKTEGRILQVPHHHIIFTIASELNDLWIANVKAMEALLFKAAKLSLLEFFEDPKYCGGRPGIIAVLHTWGRSLALHPHLHCIVTSGGLSALGVWLTPRNKCVLPAPALSELFRGKLLALVRVEIAKGRLKLPPGVTASEMKRLIAVAYDKRWSIFVSPAGSRVQTIINYLGRYVSGGPIGNSRILKSENGIVTFMHRNYRVKDAAGRPVEQPMTLTRDEFIKRWFLHVPMPHAKTVRSFGIYSPGYRGKRPCLPRRFNEHIEPTSAPPHQTRDVMRCPDCGEPLVLRLITRPSEDRGPPLGCAA